MSMKLFERTQYLYELFACAIFRISSMFLFRLWVYRLFLHMQIDEIKCTLLHKISYFIFARVVKQGQNCSCLSILSMLFISAYLENISHFALFFASLEIFFSLTVCIKYGFTGTCQMFADIYKNIPQTGKVIHIYQVCTCI